MPGIMSHEELLNPPAPHSLSEISLRYRGRRASTSDLVNWEASDMDQLGGVKCIVAQLVAAIGWELASEVIVDFDER